MKIAITADLHLTTQETNPERYQAFADILDQCGKSGIEVLVIAGDLFEKNFKNFSDFESTCRKHAKKELKIFIIPGNHDSELVSSAITNGQVTVIEEPTIESFDSEFLFLVVPYAEKTNMGEQIAPFKDKLPLEKWILISHGDWIGGVQPSDSYEQGVYMPISNADIAKYAPFQIFLGHIHLPSDSGKVHYVGSPCPIKSTETGQRRFIIFDTREEIFQEAFVNCPWLYFNEDFVVLPVENEKEYLTEQIRQRIEGWEIPSTTEQKIKVSVSIKGYTQDRSSITQLVEEEFSKYELINDELIGKDLNQEINPDKANLASEIKKWIDELVWEESEFEPGKDEIVIEALRTIYED